MNEQEQEMQEMKSPFDSARTMRRRDGTARRARAMVVPAAARIVAVVAALWSAPLATAWTQTVQTVRYELPPNDLSNVGNELFLDYQFPPQPAEIVKTRFDLTFEVDEEASFDAARLGIVFQPPIDDPDADDDRVLTIFRTGADFGWSGAGTFTFAGETDELNGQVLDAPPGAIGMLYGIGLFNAGRLEDPDDISPIAGQFISSYIEVDYVVVPEPAGICLFAGAGLFIVSSRLRQRP